MLVPSIKTEMDRQAKVKWKRKK